MKTETHDAMSFFSKALLRFTEALAEDQSNPLAIDGSIQRFEFCFELGWKLLKKMLMDLEGVLFIRSKIRRWPKWRIMVLCCGMAKAKAPTTILLNY